MAAFITCLLFCVIKYVSMAEAQMSTSALTCRDRNNHLRQDGGLCFEIPPWQHQPVELEQHVSHIKAKWGGAIDTRKIMGSSVALVNSEVSRYIDTVLSPFLDTYHRNIQNSYQQLSTKILKKIKLEINGAVKKKQQVYKELISLADELNVPEMCNEERREARTLASNHVAQIYACTEEARASIVKMGKYAEEMIAITRSHMQISLSNVARTLGSSNKVAKPDKQTNVTDCLKSLCRSAVQLGYELDLSLTNARRHNEQSCEKLTNCCNKARRNTEEEVVELKDQLHQCVYA